MTKVMTKVDGWRQKQLDAIAYINRHPVLGALSHKAQFVFDLQYKHVQPKGWAQVSNWGYIWLHSQKHAQIDEWVRVLALCLLNLGFGHVMQKPLQPVWELAALLVSDRFCSEMGMGQLPEALLYTPVQIPSGGVEALFTMLASRNQSEDEQLLAWRQAFNGGAPVFADQGALPQYHARLDWKKLLAAGIVGGVERAIAIVANRVDDKGIVVPLTRGQKARQWIMDNFPLLGAMAAGFDLVEDLRQCHAHDIAVAAIDVGAQRIYLNPTVELDAKETRFVLAHELLHAGLNHMTRQRGRDHQLWNVACDFVINGWLMQMQVGAAPSVGMLYDTAFENKSAEEIYDLLATDMRRARKLMTLRGNTLPDMIGDDRGKLFTSGEEYCRRALMQGLERCFYGGGRGLVPAGLAEEIRSLNQPPIPWDVRLAEWFDAQFPPLELHRTYARPSRRQAATPDIPRASIARPSEERCASRVFGVVLDTSGSMEPQLLGKALGAIASFALSRDVYAVRLVCCDACAYDSGWVEPEQLLYRFTVKGRGGTVLQPGLDLLEAASLKGDFPKQGPVLIITDGECEPHLNARMTHAYLLPQGKNLPFVPRVEIFHVS